MKGMRALDALLLDPSAPEAASIIAALKRIAPNATTAAALAVHLGHPREVVDSALDMLAAVAAVDTMPRGDESSARLHARQIGRATWRESECQYVSISVGSLSIKKKNKH